VTFDLPASRIYLAPNSSIHQPFLYDGSGLTFNASGPSLHTFTVSAIRPYSPATDAQINVGDILTRIDDQAADSMTLADIRAMFDKVGETYHLTFLRDGQSLKVNLSVKARI